MGLRLGLRLRLRLGHGLGLRVGLGFISFRHSLDGVNTFSVSGWDEVAGEMEIKANLHQS